MGGKLWGRGEFGVQAKLELGKGTTVLIVMNEGAQRHHCRAQSLRVPSAGSDTVGEIRQRNASSQGVLELSFESRASAGQREG